MAILQWSLVLFLSVLLTHVLVWRIRKPRSPLKALLVIVLMVPATGLAILSGTAGSSSFLGLRALPNIAAYLHVLLFTTSAGLAYMVGYTLLEWDSPTLTIVRMIESAGSEGIGEADLLKRFHDQPSFLESRIETLMRSRILVEKDGRYVLSSGRHLFFRIILLYPRLTRADQHSG
jgi:hypothetical protein